MTRSPRSRSTLLWVNLAVFGCAANWIILQREDHLENGRMVLLAINKYDHRSLMQGDYLTLTYPICREIDGKIGADSQGEGTVVIRIDAEEIGHLRRLHGDETLADDEILLHYRIRSGRTTKVRVAAEQFFVQAGLAENFARARYAELRVTPAGRSLLVALCDEQRRRIGR